MSRSLLISLLGWVKLYILNDLTIYEEPGSGVVVLSCFCYYFYYFLALDFYGGYGFAFLFDFYFCLLSKEEYASYVLCLDYMALGGPLSALLMEPRLAESMELCLRLPSVIGTMAS